MSQPTERRRPDRKPEDELSPEYLAVLEICGGEIRESDRALLRALRTPPRAPARERRVEDRRRAR